MFTTGMPMLESVTLPNSDIIIRKWPDFIFKKLLVSIQWQDIQTMDSTRLKRSCMDGANAAGTQNYIQEYNPLGCYTK
jgi:hypothetical protein